MPDELERFLRNLQISFSNPGLLKLALTHRSLGSKNNERLEFLGDAVLGYIISEKLFQQYPEIKEGDLSRLRASLVRKETLAELARENGFSEVLKLGPGELKSGGSNRGSVLADAFEALIGALLLDQGIEYVREYLLRIYADKFNSIPDLDELKDAKTRLQEFTQDKKYSLPQYLVIREKIDHPQEFVVVGKIIELGLEVEAINSNKRKAEQQVAKLLLDKINK